MTDRRNGQAETSPQGVVLSGVFSFDPADPIYADHFPGCPVVPGSVIISAFLDVLRTSAGDVRPERIQDFKFRTFLSPGEYPFLMEYRGNRLQCRLFQPEGGRRPLVTGTILLQCAG